MNMLVVRTVYILLYMWSLAWEMKIVFHDGKS